MYDPRFTTTLTVGLEYLRVSPRSTVVVVQTGQWRIAEHETHESTMIPGVLRAASGDRRYRYGISSSYGRHRAFCSRCVTHPPESALPHSIAPVDTCDEPCPDPVTPLFMGCASLCAER